MTDNNSAHTYINTNTVTNTVRGALYSATEQERARRLFRLGTLIAFLLSFAVYCLTLDPAASWWDCPEYILVASRLEVGHSPGNPTWMIFHNVAASLAEAIGGPTAIAPALNLCSALFTALAVALLYQICFFCLRYAFRRKEWFGPEASALASMTGAMCLGWADTPWFSAVETEVYAMSLFFTTLMLRVMISWARTADPGAARRKLVLLGYLTGLSIGVHELNMLAIPALALIYVFRRYPGRCRGKAWLALFGSTGALGLLLMCIYPGTSMIAGEFELFAVNTLHLPFHSGVVIYLCALVSASVLAPLAAGWRSRSTWALVLKWAAFTMMIFLSALFLLNRHFLLSLFLSSALGAFLAVYCNSRRERVRTSFLILALTLLGFSTYMVIPIRAAANPPVNENAPTDVFSFLSYLKRDQYGKRPLFYGPTPYAKPMYKEVRDSAGEVQYPEYYKVISRANYKPAVPAAVVSTRSGLLTAADSAENSAAIKGAEAGEDRYLLSDYRYDLVYTPELNMIMPRLTSHNARDISNYESWAGMTRENMDEVQVSFAIDSLGNPVGRLTDGKRIKEKNYRPTYLQNLRELFGYQISYMYFRYILWNYMGRGNDYPSGGEIEHGGVLTGITPVDELMLGDGGLMPAELGKDNRGRNVLYMLPLIFGITGIVAGCVGGRRLRRLNAVTAALFVMTGVAIVVFLNQDPGEPRERDYSFMGSMVAFSLWIAMGAVVVLRCGRMVAEKLVARFGNKRMIAVVPKAFALILVIGLPLMMLAVNYDDHDRSGRNGPTDYATNLLESLDEDAILFVDGDNVTFPTWYAQEVLGIRKDVRIVSISYLLTPWYVVQQLIPGEKSEALKMQGTPETVGFDAFSLVRVPTTGDSVTGDAVEELKKLYASRERIPKFDKRYVRIPAANRKDSIVIDLLKATGGSSNMNLRTLAMIDIVASNAASASPRPVYWQDVVIASQMSGMAPHTSRALYARKFTPGKDPLDSLAYLTGEAMKFIPEIRYGGADKEIYADPYVGEQITRQRMALLRLADALLREGHYYQALHVATIIYEKFPSDVWPYQAKAAGRGVLWQEGLKLADIMETAGTKTHDVVAVASARSLRRSELERLRRWNAWYRSLPKWQRDAFSTESRLLLQSLPKDSIVDEL